MIKEKGSHFGPWTTAYCDSCHNKMFECAQIHWEEGQELFYAPLLCEKCGTEHSKFVGNTVKENEELKKKITELKTKIEWSNEKINEVIDFLDGRIKHLSVRKEELEQRLARL